MSDTKPAPKTRKPAGKTKPAPTEKESTTKGAAPEATETENLEDEKDALNQKLDEKAERELVSHGVGKEFSKDIIRMRKFILVTLTAVVALLIFGMGILFALTALKSSLSTSSNQTGQVIEQEGVEPNDNIVSPDRYQIWKEAYQEGFEDGYSLNNRYYLYPNMGAQPNVKEGDSSSSTPDGGVYELYPNLGEENTD